MIDEKDIDRARKVYALVKGGATQGEKDAAQSRFDAIALRNSISVSHLLALVNGTTYRPTPIMRYVDPVIAKRRRYLRKDYEEFLEEYRASRKEFGLGIWVPARLMAMTGWILWELHKVGYADKEGDSFMPGDIS